MALATKTERTEKATFYEKLSKYDASWAKRKAVEFKQSADRTLTEWEVQGNILIEAKARLGHGNFEEWVATEFTPNYKIGIDTAERLMNAAEMLKGRPKLGGYGYTLVAELSKPQTPPEVIEEAEERVETENPMSVREVQKKVKELKPKPLFQKGQIVEFFSGAERTMGRIESIHTLKEKNSFEYKIAKLHGPSFKGKFLEHNLKLCPVQTRHNYYDDCYHNPEPETQVIFCPITSWGQTWKDQVFTVVSNSNDWVVISNENQKNIYAHWAELKPYEQPVEIVKTKAGEATIDVQAVEVRPTEQPYNNLQSPPESEITTLVYKLCARIKELEDFHIHLLLDGLNAEISSRNSVENS